MSQTLGQALTELNVKNHMDLLKIGIGINKESNEQKKLKQYLNVIKIIEQVHIVDPNIYWQLFEIVGLIPPNSANGTAFIIQFRGNPNKKFLVKVPLSPNADSLVYEYYIGLALNTLKLSNIENIFSSTYGKMTCGLDKLLLPIEDPPNSHRYKHNPVTKNTLDIIDLCNPTFASKFHLITEFIDHPNKRLIKPLESFQDYLEQFNNVDQMTIGQINSIEENCIDIMITVLSNLDIANQELDFTHYDLHTGNILLTHLSNPISMNVKIDGVSRNIITSMAPTIIDYGRCYINPKAVDQATRNIKNNIRPKQMGDDIVYIDDHLPSQSFDEFEKYQKELFGRIDYSKTRPRNCYCYNPNTQDCTEFCRIDTQIHDWIKLNTNYLGMSENDAKKLIIDKIFNKYRSGGGSNYDNQLLINRYNFGINSDIPNKHYDLYRLCRIVLKIMINVNNHLNARGERTAYDPLWILLADQLYKEYPFYIPVWYSLPCDYHISDVLQTNKPWWGWWLDTPGNVAKLLYYAKYSPNFMTRIQRGGREKIENIQKIYTKDIIQNMDIKTNLVDDVDRDRKELFNIFKEQTKNFDRSKYLDDGGIVDQRGMVQREFPLFSKKETE